MFSVKIIAVGKLKEKFYLAACGEYLKRLGTMADVSIVELPEETGRPDGLEHEAEKILAAIPKQSYVCAMCVEGKMMDSPALARVFSDIQNRGYSSMTIIIGSSNGMSDSVKSRADMRLSMSPMTFPHQLARVMLLEQTYRAMKIAAGERYHK